jgi:hypothetical protein
MTSHPQQAKFAQSGLRTIEPTAGFQRTPEWHRARAQLLRWLDDPNTRWLARQHDNLAKAIDHRGRRQN